MQANPRKTSSLRHLGEAVEVNNLGIHSVRNDGTTDRIHLIFEYYDLDQPDPDWIGALAVQRGSAGTLVREKITQQ